MFAYEAYGLRVGSCIELPELRAAEFDAEDADVIVHSEQIEHPRESNYRDVCFYVTASEAYLYWPGIGTLLVRDGREIIADRAAGVTDDVLRLFILGSGLAIALHQRGRLVLHASAVAVGGCAVVFIGDKGWGKSTTSAALHARGHDLLTDDLVAIEYDIDGKPQVLPGYPQLKLWPNALESLGNDPELLPRLRPELEKRAKRIESGFAQAPLPLCCVYVLGRGEETTIEPLPPRLALMHLIRHFYVARYGTAFLRHSGNNRHLEQCSRLTRLAPVRILKRTPDLSALAGLAVLIENDLKALNQQPELS